MMTFEQSVNSKVYINNDEIKIIAIFKDDIAHYLKLTVLLHIVGLIPRGLPRFVIKILREFLRPNLRFVSFPFSCHSRVRGNPDSASSAE